MASGSSVRQSWQTLSVCMLICAPAAGVVVLRHRPQTLELLALWMHRLVGDPGAGEGAALEAIVSPADSLDTTTDHSARILRPSHGNATLGVLPISLFANGHTYFVQHMFEVNIPASP